MCFHYIVVKTTVESMSLPPLSTLERRVSAREVVRNQMEATEHSLEFRLEERVGLLKCRIRRWVKRAFECFELDRENRKFQREFNVELHGTDDDRQLMDRYNARREASGLAEFDRNVERLREAVHEASVNRSREQFVLACMYCICYYFSLDHLNYYICVMDYVDLLINRGV